MGGSVLGGAMGRGVRVEGVRGAEIASFGIGEVVIGRDRFVVGVCGAGRRSPRLWLLMGLLVGLVAAR